MLAVPLKRNEAGGAGGSGAQPVALSRVPLGSGVDASSALAYGSPGGSSSSTPALFAGALAITRPRGALSDAPTTNSHGLEMQCDLLLGELANFADAGALALQLCRQVRRMQAEQARRSAAAGEPVRACAPLARTTRSLASGSDEDADARAPRAGRRLRARRMSSRSPKTRTGEAASATTSRTTRRRRPSSAALSWRTRQPAPLPKRLTHWRCGQRAR